MSLTPPDRLGLPSFSASREAGSFVVAWTWEGPEWAVGERDDGELGVFPDVATAFAAIATDVLSRLATWGLRPVTENTFRA